MKRLQPTKRFLVALIVLRMGFSVRRLARWIGLFVLAGLVVSNVGCTGQAAEPAVVTVVVTATEPALAAPAATPTLEPATATPLPAPTATPSPSATSTSAPTATSTSTSTPAPTPPPTAKCVGIIDGDTIRISVKGEIMRLRYIGIDTPELDEAPWGELAKEANARLVEGQTLVLKKDQSDVDKYGRLLRYVYLLDGTFINEVLVAQGYAEARAYPPDVKYQDRLEAAEARAVEAGAGMWGATPIAAPTPRPPAPTATPRPPAATNTPAPPSGARVVIVAVDKRAEVVTVKNVGDAPQDLSGWVLVSERGNQRCALGGVLQSGQALQIWAMSKDADKGGYNCGFGSNIWNNSKSDPAVLLDAQGREVDRK